MIDVLPKFAEISLRMRIKHMYPLGTEVVILHPQGISSARRLPQHAHKEISEMSLLANKRFDSLDQALIETTYNTVRIWLNEDPIVWCQYGAKFKVNKIAGIYTITLYPYPI